MNQENTMKWEAANESHNKLEKLYKGCKFSLETQKKINEQQQQTIQELNTELEAARKTSEFLQKDYKAVEKRAEQQEQTILDLAEALNRAANDMGKRGCGLYSKELVNEYRTLAAQHIKNPIGE